MDQLICASISHIHYWYEVGMLKVPATISDRPCNTASRSVVRTPDQSMIKRPGTTASSDTAAFLGLEAPSKEPTFVA